mgnify:CR=1 FL=1
MLIDSHAHLNFEDFDAEWQQTIDYCQKNNIWMINVGSQFETSKRAIGIAEKYDKGVYASVALHPIHVDGSSFHPEKFLPDEYKNLISSSKKVVAIGETGIDFFHDDKNFSRQKEVLVQHINLAKENNLPIILHSRNSKDGSKDAYEEILKILKQENFNHGVIHCYGGNIKQALEFLNLGFFVGFTGVVTFKNAKELVEVVENLPLDSILVETDCPYLAPEPHRGEKNYPQYVKFVAEKIAKIKQIDYNEVKEQTAQNAINLFGLS